MDWKKQLKDEIKKKEKENIELKEDLEVIREDVKEFKKTGIFGHWRDYRRYWADKYYTIEESDASEVLRVKFYRAKKIYENIEKKMIINCNKDDIHSWLEGYCEGVRADRDTRDILYWLLRKNYFKEI